MRVAPGLLGLEPDLSARVPRRAPHGGTMQVSGAATALSGGAEALAAAKPGARAGGEGSALRFLDALDDVTGKAADGSRRLRSRNRGEPAKTELPGQVQAVEGAPKGEQAKADAGLSMPGSLERPARPGEPRPQGAKPESAKLPTDALDDGSTLLVTAPHARAKPEPVALRSDLGASMLAGSAAAASSSPPAFEQTLKAGTEHRRATPGQQRRDAGPAHGADPRKGTESPNAMTDAKAEPVKADNVMPLPAQPAQQQGKAPEIALGAATPQQAPQPAPAGGEARANEGTAGPAPAGYKAAEMPAPAALAPLVSIRVLPKLEGANSKALEIRLDPPELGRVDVKLETAQDGTLKAVLSAERVEALELLRRDQGTLENALRQAGVALGDNAISFSLSAGAGEQGTGGERRERHDGARAFGEAAQVQDAAMQAASIAWRDGVLDLKV